MLLECLLKLVNLLKKRDFIISNYKIDEFKLNMKKNIEMIYESSCFKMDTIFSLEFDRKKYYEDLIRMKNCFVYKQNFIWIVKIEYYFDTKRIRLVSAASLHQVYLNKNTNYIYLE